MNKTIGEVIRELRIAKGLTQEELSDGICSPVSVSRIETGNQKPSGKTLEQLLNRLDTSTYQLCDVYSDSLEQQHFIKKTDLISSLISLDRLDEAQEELSSICDYGKSNIQRFQQIKSLELGIQILKTHFDASNKEQIISAFSLTKPNFDFSSFGNCFFSPTEAILLNHYSVVCYYNGDVETAIRINKSLFETLEQYLDNLRMYRLIKINLLINLSGYLLSLKQYQDALDYCVAAEHISIEEGESYTLPEIFFFKAKCLHFLGRKEESLSLLKIIVPYLKLVGKARIASSAEIFIAENGLSLD